MSIYIYVYLFIYVFGYAVIYTWVYQKYFTLQTCLNIPVFHVHPASAAPDLPWIFDPMPSPAPPRSDGADLLQQLTLGHTRVAHHQGMNVAADLQAILPDGTPREEIVLSLHIGYIYVLNKLGQV